MTAPLAPLRALPLWTREDVANQYQVSVRTVGGWVASRRVPFLRIGRAVRFRPEAVEKALSKFEIKAVVK
jgi:excisionase family DNA binding protein